MSIFNQVPQTRISRSTHNLSHQTKGTYDGGPIYPLMCELAFPGDTWKVRLENFIRTMPMIAPILDRVDVKVDSFFCPLRLIWDDFEDFITLGPTGEFSAERPTIRLRSSGLNIQSDLLKSNKLLDIGSLSDYLNFPSYHVEANKAFDRNLDALPFRAYQLIYNEYFRNETIDSEVPISRSSGVDNLYIASPSSPELDIANFFLKYRGWRKDYFTSALPTPQKGPAVRIPFGDITIGASEDPDTHKKDAFMLGSDSQFTDTSDEIEALMHPQNRVGGGSRGNFVTDADADRSMHYEHGLKATMDTQTLPTIEELRYAECLQEYYETNARGGSRYKEHLLNIWHTRSKDARLDRPEYLGGYRGPISISDIDQTSQSDISAQGTLAGKGLSAGGQKLFKYHVPEWGIILVTMSIVPKSSYCQGYRRWNLYNDVFDWPNPFFANLGEQEIYNKELFDDDSDGLNDGTFGYTPRYAEAKYIPDSVHSQLKSTLSYWHLGRIFATRPNLNSAFLHVDPQELARIFPLQVANNDKFIGTFFFHVKRRMYLPYWGIPRLIHSV